MKKRTCCRFNGYGRHQLGVSIVVIIVIYTVLNVVIFCHRNSAPIFLQVTNVEVKQETFQDKHIEQDGRNRQDSKRTTVNDVGLSIVKEDRESPRATLHHLAMMGKELTERERERDHSLISLLPLLEEERDKLRHSSLHNQNSNSPNPRYTTKQDVTQWNPIMKHLLSGQHENSPTSDPHEKVVVLSNQPKKHSPADEPRNAQPSDDSLTFSPLRKKGRDPSIGQSREKNASRDMMSSARGESQPIPSENNSLRSAGKFDQQAADRIVKQLQLDWNLPLAGNHTSPWEVADRWPTFTRLYPQDTPQMGAVLKAMSTANITRVSTISKGSSLKLTFTLRGGQKVLFKPQRYKRNFVWRGRDPCAISDTHNGEIVTFHLSRLLGFRQTPLAVGRVVNIDEDLKSVASSSARLMFSSFHGKTCLGKPDLCPKNGQLEGALILWLPGHVTFEQSEHPWGGVCQALLHNHHFLYYLPGVSSPQEVCQESQAWLSFHKNPAQFLDLTDAAILQYLTSNADRKLYLGTGRYSGLMPVLDNGKTFGDPDLDIVEILAPLVDCCRVRNSTYHRLISLRYGALSYVLDQLTSRDPLYPLVTSDHLRALDRRLGDTLDHIHRCINHHGKQHVLMPS